ncbi:MAG TPA: plasma-membrane proton-efflux P-type ATPase [Saprospiraceae bacterium]|nr:plasma-membrane proton-efflux P-type ATPase [Saprospiraceae bacterium]MCC6688950.1 plasma-membrane proton-efflux P-type ATPase [Saprospiraceae bacterium]HMX82925.1 plasma-membrane proton-efflux P-type ATPase [Saprospiraceae bacterium]HMX84521.1 plasma-membrane proton-efflux P-type ATPase [Saprospiraceae bacterium]HMZ72774.1 plasma-membrane proton-efflux P-type ATPase [Saprospiraceae bacterium]
MLTNQSTPDTILAGLNETDIAELRAKYGYNEIEQKKKPAILLLLSKFWGLSAWMLEATVIISFALHKYFDGFVITFLLLFNGAIGFYNELKAARTVEALQQRLQVMVRVLRNGAWQLLPSRELLPGDILRIRTGDFITADLTLKHGEVKTDKSALTGETALVTEKPEDKLYAGSVIKAGEGTAVVDAIASSSYFGKTVQLVIKSEHKLHMEEVVARVAKMLFVSVLLILSLTTFIGLIGGQSLLSMLPLILILLVTAIPVGLPAMFTISMARGSRELSNKGVLVSKLSATEDAATLTTLCIDKTGTITKNELTLQDVTSFGTFTQRDVIRYGVMASVKANEDNIDLAFFDYIENNPSLTISAYQQLTFMPFDASRKHTEAVVQSEGKVMTVAKGSFIAISGLCGKTEEIAKAKVSEWAQKGFKTIAVAVAFVERDFQFAGIVALYDPPRPDAREMLAEIMNLGIGIRMLTGDALPIAREIAIQAGLGNNIISMNECRSDTDTDRLSETINSHRGFAEVLPEDKYNIVKQLQQQGEIVGMTGDGVNDAPALKQAEVGIAVKNATDVAKQSASIILIQEGLRQIIDLIKTGRTIHVNISNYTVNKIAKTILTILFVCTSFLITRTFVVTTIDMVLMLFLIDFVVLTLAVDKVSWSQKPADWKIHRLVEKGILLGFLLFLGCTAGFFGIKNLFDIQNEAMLHSLGFACLFFSAVMAIPVIRTDDTFYKAPISRLLLSVILADLLLVMLLLTFGFPGFAKLPLEVSAITLVYFGVMMALVNDPAKVYFTEKMKYRK